MRKVITLITLFAVIMCILCSCDTDNTEDQGNGSADAGVNTTTQSQGSASTTPVATQSDANLGDYNVVIESCRLAEDYAGKPIAIVKYNFTNVKDDNPTSFSWSLSDAAFQGGVGLAECYFADDSANYSSDNQTKEIKKGASVSVEVAYVLNDTTTPVEIEVSELISFSDKKVKKTFSISDGSQDQVSQTTPSATQSDANLGDYNVVIESYRLAEDYEDKPIVIVKYSFTNVKDDDAACFAWSLDYDAFQAGVGLNECYFVDDSANYSSDNQTKEIKKGASISVEVAYVLNDTTTPVEIEVSELITFSDKTITKTFSIS